MPSTTVTEHLIKTGDHQTSYLATGPEDGPLIIFVHGWPELAISWRHQLPCFGSLGFRVIAPDLRGHGRGLRSWKPFRLQDCADDAADLLRGLGTGPVIAVKHSI